MELEPQDLSHQLALSEALYENGSADEAIQLLSKTVAAQPRSGLAEFNLATLFARQKRYEEAVDHFQRSIVLDSSNDTARLSLAKALIGLDRQPDALPVLNQVLQHKPQDAEAHYLQGLVYRGLADYEHAAIDLKAAVEENPEHYESQYNYGFVLLRLGRLVRLGSIWRKPARLHPIRRRRCSNWRMCCAA